MTALSTRRKRRMLWPSPPPIIAQIVKAIAETYAADGRVSLDDLRSRLSPLENAEIDTVTAYSTVLADDAEILAVLDRPEGTAATVGDDPKARLELLAALARSECVTVLGMTSAVCLDHRRNSLSDALRLAASSCTAAAWQIVRHPQYKELRLFLPAKTTRLSDRQGLAFKIVEAAAGERVEWQEEPVPCDCLETAGDGAAGWLRQALAAGPLPSKDLLTLGGHNGYTSRMLHYAKLAAGVAITREGFGPGATWRWNLVVSNREHAKTA
jgi:hypothetical protein